MFGSAGELVFGTVSGVAALSVAAALLVRAGRSCRGWTGTARIALLYLLVPLCIAAVPAFRAARLATQPAVTIGDGTFCATVTGVRMLRYSLETELAAGTPGSAAPVRIMAYLPPSEAIGEGDVIEFTRKPRALAAGSAAGRYARGLLRRGITHTVSLSPDDYRVVSRAAPTMRRGFQSRLSERIGRLFNPATTALLKGLYFGNANHIGKDIVYHFTRAGVLHILSASGSHLTTLALLPVALLGLFRIDRRAVFLLVALVLAAYIYVTDLPVSLQRAFIMFVLGGLHLLLDHERNALNALFHSAAAIIVLQPWEIYSLGSQLTFGATLGILLFYRSYRDSLRPLPGLLGNPLALTLSAQSLIFPVLAAWLGEINLISLVSNLVVVPLVELVFAASAGLLLLDASAPGLAQAPAALLDLCYAAGARSAVFFSSLPGHFTPGAIAPALVIPYLLYLAPLVRKARWRPPAMLCLPAACAIAWLMLAGPPVKAGDVAVLTTQTSRAAYTVIDGAAHVAGTVGSLEDARLLARAIGGTGAGGTVSLRLSGLNFKNIDAASHMAKTLCLSSFTIEGDFIYGKYLGRLCSILDRDGVRLATERGVDSEQKPGADTTKRSDALARKRAASLLEKALAGRDGASPNAAPRWHTVRIDSTRRPGGG